MSTVTQIVVSDRGIGFHHNGELRKAIGIHVSPELKDVRPATEQEAREFFLHRLALKRELVGIYARSTFSGD